MAQALNLNDDLIREMLQREIAKQTAIERVAPSAEASQPSTQAISPGLLSMLAGVADAGSTYAGLANGGTERNPLYRGASDQPGATSLLVGATNTLGPWALAKLLRRTPLARFADPLLANHAATEMDAAAHNLKTVSR